ncbi:MAG: dihydropteroate synthase [Arenicellales bacterium]|nr:dihydropteroate synthase [Arenicellales bacterium]MDP6948601.1 dihydropteroate synthase [Arenicellales bacterium]
MAEPCGVRRALTSGRALIMGVVNVTPDSFSDGGRYRGAQAAISHARQLVREGADIIDVGGESTRPGAQPVSTIEELDRVLPVIETLADNLDVPISVDTSKPEVMQAAVTAGAGLINDVLALRAPGALETAAQLQVPVCLMHMQGVPATMQNDPTYGDVVSEVVNFLSARAQTCSDAGLAQSLLLTDPGFGFGKTFIHNRSLLAGLGRLVALGLPVVVGLSRKSFARTVAQTSGGGLADVSAVLGLLAVQRGARIMRVHDVAVTRKVLSVWETVQYATDN